MIRVRRLTHWYVFVGLAFVIPALMATGVGLRPQVPPILEIDPVLLSNAGFGADVPAEARRIQAGKHAFEVAVQASNTQSPTLIIRPTATILKPDLLVYWIADTKVTARLPEDAVLLGELAGTSPRRMPIPPAAANGHGSVMIFSLAHQSVIAQFPIHGVLGSNEGVRE